MVWCCFNLTAKMVAIIVYWIRENNSGRLWSDLEDGRWQAILTQKLSVTLHSLSALFHDEVEKWPDTLNLEKNRNGFCILKDK